MHLFLEIFTLLAFLGCLVHAVRCRPGIGGWFFFAISFMGILRENFVALRDYLYGFAPLTLMAGKAPLISAIIWGFSVYAGLAWAERMAREETSTRNSARFFFLVGLFMTLQAFFYEPFLKLVGMAHWQQGTQKYLDVPLIAMIGYPTMTWLFLFAWQWSLRRYSTTGARTAALVVSLTAVSLFHVVVLQALKDALGW